MKAPVRVHWVHYTGAHRIACGKRSTMYSTDINDVTCATCIIIAERSGVQKQLKPVEGIYYDVPVATPTYRNAQGTLERAAAMLEEQFEAQRKRWGWI